jgi:hypothetical protein
MPASPARGPLLVVAGGGSFARNPADRDEELLDADRCELDEHPAGLVGADDTTTED